MKASPAVALLPLNPACWVTVTEEVRQVVNWEPMHIIERVSCTHIMYGMPCTHPRDLPQCPWKQGESTVARSIWGRFLSKRAGRLIRASSANGNTLMQG